LVSSTTTPTTNSIAAIASVNLVVAACPGQSFHSTLDGPGQALAEFLVHIAQPFTLNGVGRFNVSQLGRF